MTDSPSHDVSVRVRYCETDAMGYLHHANHINYFEMGRTELLRAQGGNYREMEEAGYFLVVIKIECDYKTPAKYDDLLTVRTRVAKQSEARAVQPPSSDRSHSECSTNRSGSGVPSSPNGVRTGAITPEKLNCSLICFSI